MMSGRKRPFSHTWFFLLTALLVGVVVLLVALPRAPRYSREDYWRSFQREDAIGGLGEAALARPVGQPAPGADWLVSATLRSRLGSHIHHVQTIAGRPVLGSWATEHRLLDGRRIVAGRMCPIPPAETPDADPEASEALALSRLGVHGLRDRVSTVAAWAPTEDGLRAVHVVTVPARDPLGDFRVVIDPGPREVLSVENLISLDDASGWVFTATPSLACGRALSATDADLLPFVSEEPLDHLDGSGYLDGRYVRALNGTEPRAIEPDGRFLHPPSSDVFEQVMCYRTITHYFAYVESLGVVGYGGRRIVADARGYAGDNSFFSPATGRIVFGTGGVPDAQDVEIIIHELGHALHHTAQPAYAETDDSRAVSEGIADYLACSYSDDAYLAEWDADAYSATCPRYLRRLDVPRRYPEDMTGEIHRDGLVLATALWQVRAAIGARTTDRILLESLFFLRPDSDVRHAARMFSATEEMLFEGAYTQTIDDVFRSWGLNGEPGVEAPPPGISAHASPNPFRATTSIRYSIPTGSDVRVRVVDVQGRLVSEIVNGRKSAGTHTVTWDGSDMTGHPAPPGVYFYRVVTGGASVSGKLVRVP